jgi:hypothetical protein
MLQLVELGPLYPQGQVVASEGVYGR